MDIQWHVVTNLDSARRVAAENRIRKLSEGKKDLIHVVIHVEGSNHHQHGAAEVKIRCQAKGRELIAHPTRGGLLGGGTTPRAPRRPTST